MTVTCTKVLLALVAMVATSAAQADSVSDALMSNAASSNAQLNEKRIPVHVKVCDLPEKGRCREASIGMRGGSLVIDGDLSKDEILMTLAASSWGGISEDKLISIEGITIGLDVELSGQLREINRAY